METTLHTPAAEDGEILRDFLFLALDQSSHRMPFYTAPF